MFLSHKELTQLTSTQLVATSTSNAHLVEYTLKNLHKQIGTYAFARWAHKMGYSFEYTHKIIFNRAPQEFKTYPHSHKR